MITKQKIKFTNLRGATGIFLSAAMPFASQSAERIPRAGQHPGLSKNTHRLLVHHQRLAYLMHLAMPAAISVTFFHTSYILQASLVCLVVRTSISSAVGIFPCMEKIPMATMVWVTCGI
jgi:hypothetical protein